MSIRVGHVSIKVGHVSVRFGHMSEHTPERSDQEGFQCILLNCKKIKTPGYLEESESGADENVIIGIKMNDRLNKPAYT